MDINNEDKFKIIFHSRYSLAKALNSLTESYNDYCFLDIYYNLPFKSSLNIDA